jgi:hypothetical protein
MDTECEYCQKGKVISQKLNGYTGKIKIHGNLLNTEIKNDENYGWANMAYYIKYCPWCGRPLTGSDKHEIAL